VCLSHTAEPEERAISVHLANVAVGHSRLKRRALLSGQLPLRLESRRQILTEIGRDGQKSGSRGRLAGRPLLRRKQE
jgi:hypothetical protein